MSVKAIPEGFHSLTVYMGVKDAAKAIEFYKEAFGAVESFRLSGPDGRVGHAELQIGDSRLMLCDPCDQGGFSSADPNGVTSFGMHLYVTDVDAQFKRAIDAGAKVSREVQDQFYGDRSGTLRDPFGHLWFIATHKEDLTPEEIGKRAEVAFKQAQP
ncbi:VOC family protein [Pseudomonas sp. CCI4.2]|uniref:VOC family protein n=1 Tax=Pseudomonas sp. CCI4.2 TaxID=3048620 RepID=UPI002AC8B9B4|nr:VOC family protein [Pseudomonas sp. CCI4.2]MEB0091718.1 VOC family protein [Pseudomonas sp. CCI4.2]WPX56282.1 VOC family protein [Pseudomonas sp. CCI4.2]